MDLQLKEIIEKIKQDGIDEAQQKADDIITKAKQESEKIISEANRKSEDLKQKAFKEIQTKENSSKEILNQAGRDLILLVKKDLENLFKKALEKKVDEKLNDANVLKSALIDMFKNTKFDGSVVVQLNKKLKHQLETVILNDLNAKQKIEIKPLKEFNVGFRLLLNNGNLSYDFSTKEVVSILSELVNDNLAELIKE